MASGSASSVPWDSAQGGRPHRGPREPLYEGDTLIADADSFAAHQPCTESSLPGQRIRPSAWTLCWLTWKWAGCKAHQGSRPARIHARDGSVRIEREGALPEGQLLRYEMPTVVPSAGRRRPGRGAFGARENQTSIRPTTAIRAPRVAAFATRELARPRRSLRRRRSCRRSGCGGSARAAKRARLADRTACCWLRANLRQLVPACPMASTVRQGCSGRPAAGKGARGHDSQGL